jgi:hypothetical protein
MSYAERNLGKDETILLRADFHKIEIILWAILGVITFITIVFPIIALVMILSARMRELCFTTKRSIGRYGYIVGSKSLDLPLNKIAAVQLEQGLGGKIFGYGTILVSTGIDKMAFPYVANPEVFRRALMEQIEIYDNERIKKQAEEMAQAMAK